MSVLETAIGWLSPPLCVRCGEEGRSLCSGCSSLLQHFGERCWRCNRLSPNSKTCTTCRRTGSPSQVFIRTDYSGLARDLLQAYKFDHQRAAAYTISSLMLEFMPVVDHNYLIVPVPTATTRQRERSFDHTLLLAKHISARLRLPYDQSLRRFGQTRQLGARRDDRLKQLTDSFSVKNPKLVANQSILLIDDVVTTGGTIMAATQALCRVGVSKVDALLFAKRL